MPKKERFITPVGLARYPKLDEVDVFQPLDKKGKPSGAEKRRYVTGIIFSDTDLAEVQAKLKAKAKELLPDCENPKLPIKKDKKTGQLFLEATSGEKYRPAVFDAKNNKIPGGLAIGGGTKMKLDVSINAYEGFGGGINLYMNAVQVLDLVEKGVGKSNFGEEEGYAHENDEPAKDHNDDSATGEESFNF
jgi:hypothetical protein